MSTPSSNILSSPFLTLKNINGLLATIPREDHTRRIQYLTAKAQALMPSLRPGRQGEYEELIDASPAEYLETSLELAREYLITGQYALAEAEADRVRVISRKNGRKAGQDAAYLARQRDFHVGALSVLIELDEIRDRKSRAKRWAAERKALIVGSG